MAVSFRDGANVRPGPPQEQIERVAQARPSERTCPQCDGARASPLRHYSTENWHVVQCLECNFVYLQNAPDYERLVSEFAWEKTSVSEALRREKSLGALARRINRATRWRLTKFPSLEARVLRRAFAPGRVLDVGCGMDFVIPEPFVPFGIDVSEAIARQAHEQMSKRGGRVVHAAAIDGIAEFPNGYFSGVLLRGLLEHEKRPKQLLQGVRRVLAPGGAIYLKTPNYGGINRRVMGAKWCGFRYPDHVNYFTVKTLTRMAADCGFTLKLVNPLRLAFDDSIKAVLRRM